jgi:hypothetical protein
MTPTAVSLARGRACVLAFVLPVLAALAASGGCAETRRATGDACFKSVDCLSGICTQQVCTAAPPTTDQELDAEAGPAVVEAGGDASDGGGGGSEAAAEAASEGGGSGEAAASEGGGD